MAAPSPAWSMIDLSGSSSPITIDTSAANWTTGDLCLVFIGTDGDNTLVDASCFMGSDSTLLTKLAFQSNGSAVFGSVLFRWIDGTETDSTVYVEFNENEKADAIVVKYDAGDVIDFSIIGNASAGTGTSDSPDGPSVPALDHARDVTYMAFAAWDHNDTWSAAPSNYTDLQHGSDGSSTGCGVAVAYREMTSQSAAENPGAFTLSGSEEWVAYSLAVLAPETDLIVEAWPMSSFLAVGNLGKTDIDMQAQPFVARSADSLNSVDVHMREIGYPSDYVVCELRDGYDGNTLATSDNVTVTDDAYYTFTFSSPYTLSAGTTYWLVFYRTGTLNDSNYFQILCYQSTTFWGWGWGSPYYHQYMGSWYTTTAEMSWQGFTSSGPAGQNVNASLIQQLGSILSASLTFGGIDVNAGFISQTGVIYSPSLLKTLDVDAALIQQLGAALTPALTYGGVDVNMALIQQLGQAFSPVLDIELGISLIQQLGAALAPTISYGNLNVNAALIQQLGQALAATVSYGNLDVNVALIQQLGQVFDVVPGTAIPLGLIQNIGVEFAPSLGLGTLNVPALLISQIGQVSAPTIQYGGINVPVTLISNLGQALAPSLTMGGISVNVTMISQTGQVFAPSLSKSLNLGVALISNTGQVFAASLTKALNQPIAFIQNLGQVFAPSDLTYGGIDVTPALIQQLGQAFAAVPFVGGGSPQNVDALRIQQLGLTYAPTLETALDLGVSLISNAPVVFEPSFAKIATVPVGKLAGSTAILAPTLALNLNVQPSLIQSLGGMFPVGVTFNQNINVELIQRLGSILAPSQVGEYEPSEYELWLEYIEDWFSNEDHVCKNKTHKHWRRSPLSKFYVP